MCLVFVSGFLGGEELRVNLGDHYWDYFGDSNGEDLIGGGLLVNCQEKDRFEDVRSGKLLVEYLGDGCSEDLKGGGLLVDYLRNSNGEDAICAVCGPDGVHIRRSTKGERPRELSLVVVVAAFTHNFDISGANAAHFDLVRLVVGHVQLDLVLVLVFLNFRVAHLRP